MSQFNSNYDPGDIGVSSQVYMEEGFRNLIEDHLQSLKNHTDNLTIEVTPAEANRFEYNFYNLLRYKSVPYHLHWIVLRMNDRISPFDSCKDIQSFIQPDENVINVLLSYYNTIPK